MTSYTYYCVDGNPAAGELSLIMSCLSKYTDAAKVGERRLLLFMARKMARPGKKATRN
jgi:hypothetical protein